MSPVPKTPVPKTPAPNRQRQKPIPAKAKRVRALNSSRSSPAWLTSLRHLQNRCTTLTGCLVTALLITYSWSAHSENFWQQSYIQLEDLKKQERQLMQKNEELKNDLATQARKPEMGLVSPNPAEAIALEPAIQTTKSPKSVSPTTQPTRFTSLPLGY